MYKKQACRTIIFDIQTAPWHTINMDAALQRRRQEGYPVLEEDMAKLSPLLCGHINMQGRYLGYQDHASGARDDRPGLKICLADMREGGVLIVRKLDRLGRSLSHLIWIVEGLKLACGYFDAVWITHPPKPILQCKFDDFIQVKHALHGF